MNVILYKNFTFIYSIILNNIITDHFKNMIILNYLKP